MNVPTQTPPTTDRSKEGSARARCAARLRAAAPWVAMIGGGLLLRGAFAPFAGQASIAFFAPVPLLLASRLCAPRRAAALGFAWGFAFFASALTWFVPLVRNGGPWPIVLLGELGLSAWCALFPALAAAALSRLRAPWRGLRETARATHARLVAADPGSDEEDEAADELSRLRRRSLAWEVAGPIAAGLVWAGAETLRARIGGGFAWYSLGASQRAFPALAQLAAAGGVALVSAVVATLADALAGVALRAWDTIRHTPGSTRRHLDLTVALVALLAAFLWGSRHAREAQRLERNADRTLLVAAVNPRMPCIFSNDDAAAREAEDRLVTLSASAALLHPDLVAWPETTLPDVLPSPRLEADLRELSGMIGAPILAGSTELPPGKTLRAASLVWNSAWIFSTNGVSPPYRKRHLVPFGEFIPLDETIPALRRLSPAGVSCAAGAGPVLLPVARRGAEGPDDEALVSPLICFEDTVPATARESARGADILLSISNDAWFEGTCESAQHHAEAAFRAIENGVPLVRVSNHGATGVVLPSGEATPDATGGFLVHAVPLLPRGRAPTPYARFCDWPFGFPCAALALLAAFLPGRRPVALPSAIRRLRRRLGPVWGAVLLMFVAQRFADLVNAFIGIWLVPRYVPQGELGAVLPLAQVAAFVAMPLSILLTPYAKLLNVHAERGEPGKVKAMFRDAALLALAVLLFALAATPLFFPLVFRHFGIQNGNLALAIVVAATIGALSPVFTESLRALKRFGVSSAMGAATAPVRLAVMWLALPFRGLTGYFVGQAAGPAFQSGVAVWDFLRRHRGVRCEPYFREDRRVFLAFAVPLAISTVAGNLRGMAEMMPMALVPDVESAAFYQLTRFTEISSYLGLTLVFVLFPVVSARHERGEDTRRFLLQTMWGSLAIGLCAAVALALAGRPLFGAVGFLRPYAAYTGYLFPLGVLASVRIASSCFTTHEMACTRFRFLRYTVPIALAEAAALWLLARRGSFGWRLHHIVAAMLAGATLTFAGNLVELALARRPRR